MKILPVLILNGLLLFWHLPLKAHGSLMVILKDSPGQLLFHDAETFVERRRLQIEDYPHEIATWDTGEFAVITHYGNPPSGPEGHSISVVNVAEAELTHLIELPEGSKPHGVVFINHDEALVTVECNRQGTLVQRVNQTPEDETVTLQSVNCEVNRSYLL